MEKDLELSLQRKGLENPSRRRLLRNLLAASGGLAVATLDPDFERHLAQVLTIPNPAGCVPAVHNLQSDPKYKDYIVDLNQALKNELKDKRESPHLLTGRFPPRRADWDQHLSRPGNDVGGLDFPPVEYPTEIVPAASGLILRTIDNDPGGSGMKVIVTHPFGYYTLYDHLAGRYEIPNKPQAKLERSTIMAIMGNSGINSRGITHLHITLAGPSYSRYLSGIKMQNRPARDSSSLESYVLDPEEFSIAGKGNELPYQKPEDKSYDENLWFKHFEAQKYLETLLKEFPKGRVQIITFPSQRRLEKVHNIRPIDREIDFIYSSIIEQNHPFSKNDLNGILKTLQGYMLQAPRLTAPIKEVGKENNYRYLSDRRVSY